jgi:hypothetical protein
MKRISFACALLFIAAGAALAGPPFQTDDPEPIDFRHYEFYTFGTADVTHGEADTVGPAVEFNWGALPNVHLHMILPAAAIFPRNDPGAPKAFGLGDMELGIKYKFIQETASHPMVGTFVMFEMPTGSADKGLGVGKTWYKLPLWVQKSWGPWTTYGGAGETIVKAAGYRNYPFAGWLVQRDLGKKVTLGTEVFYHGPEGVGTPLNRPATMIDIGGYYKFRDPGFQLLFCYGHTAIGQPETYGYLGLYWTWGNEKGGDGDKDKTSPTGFAFNQMGPPGLMGHS